MPRYNMWVEPANYEDIEHIRGCISKQGCRCASYADLNPRSNLPPTLREELEALDKELGSGIEPEAQP